MLDEATRVLKKKSQILVSGYLPSIYKLPIQGEWCIYAKGWVEPKPIKDPSVVVKFLKEKGFHVEFSVIPNLYWCARGYR